MEQQTWTEISSDEAGSDIVEDDRYGFKIIDIWI